MMKKPTPVCPSTAIVLPGSKRRSFIELASPWSSLLSRSEKSGTCWMSSCGAAMDRILSRPRPEALGLNGLDTPGKLFDSALGRVQFRRAQAIELLAPLPERDRLVEARLAALEALDDPFQLALRVLEGRLGHRVSSTRAPKPPIPSSTSTRLPEPICELARTISPAARTIAYPRSSVARGESARRRPADCSSAARRRSSRSRGA